MPGPRARRRFLALLVLLCVIFHGRARAQDGHDDVDEDGARAAPLPAANARTGLEAHLSGASGAVVGRPYLLRGTAYEVRGLATLAVLPGAHVHARIETNAEDFRPAPWTDAVAGADGRFALSVPVPLATHGPVVQLVVRIADARDHDERRLEQPISVSSPYHVDLFTDRNLYEPGEPVHAWARITDVTGAPVVGVPVRISGSDLGAPRTLATSAAGVVSMTAELAETALAGPRDVAAYVGEGPASQSAQAYYNVGRRNVERLLVDVDVTPDTVPLEGEATLKITVHAASGAPVRDAVVSASVDGSGTAVRQVTGPDGRAVLGVTAPAYLDSDTGWVGVTVQVRHPAYGARDVHAGFALAQPMVLEVGVTAPAGGLVPEVAAEAWVLVATPGGVPAPHGTPVTVTGVAVRSGTFHGTTDAHGLVAVPMLVAPGAAVRHGEEASQCPALVATSVDVSVDVDPPRAAHVCLPVASDTLVAIRVTQPVVAPGDRLGFTLARRQTVRTRDVAVDLFSGGGRVAQLVVPARDGRGEVVVPPGALGPLLLRARPLGLDGVSEGAGGSDVVLSRPAHPSLATVTSDRDVYPVRGTAHLTVHTDPAAPHGWVALVARDLAMHGGERAFALSFLGQSLDRALLDPATPEAERLLRSAMAANTAADETPAPVPPLVDALGATTEETWPGVSTSRDDLRDPIAAALELGRRGVAPMMTACESALTEALDSGDTESLAAIVTGTGAQRRFRDDVIVNALGDDAKGLGDGPVTPAMLSAVDPSFGFDSAARRVARGRLVRLLTRLAAALEPPDDGSGETARSVLASDPPERWLSRLLRLGVIEESALVDPWGGHFALHRSAHPAIAIGVRAAGWELVSPGPDGALGTHDDVRDPFARAITAGTAWAIASGEDALMDQLSQLAPGEQTLAAIAAAYARMTEDAAEEARGDAALASASEEWGGGYGEGTIGLGSLGTIGHGMGGGGSGSGYGSGMGRMGSRSSRAPSIRVGSAVGGGGFGRLSALIRRRFPATLLFLPEKALDASGATPIDLPLADAVTTYLVEAIVWDAGGWTWSTSTTVRVDRDVVVDAPVPVFATVGDELLLDVSVANRTENPLDVRVARLASEPLGLAASEPVAINLAAHGATATTMRVVLPRAAEGVLTLGVTDAHDTPLDALERPLAVRPSAWTYDETSEALVRGTGTLDVDVRHEALPAGATASLEILAGAEALTDAAVARRSDTTAARLDATWAAWVRAMRGLSLRIDDADRAHVDLQRCAIDALRCAAAVGALWQDRGADDDELRAALDVLGADRAQRARRGGAPSENDADLVMPRAAVLLGLAPAVVHAGERPTLRDALEAVATHLRDETLAAALSRSDAPEVAAMAAAALVSAREGTADDVPLGRIDELLRRARRGLVLVSDLAWLPRHDGDAQFGLLGTAALRRHGASAALALAAASRGDTELAFSLVRTLRGARGPEDAPPLGAVEAAIAAVAAARLTGESAVASLQLRTDGGAWRTVPLADGRAQLDLPAVARAGVHHVELRLGSTQAIAVVRATTSVRLPFTRSDAGPFALSIEGDVPHRDERARDLVVVVRSRLPRLVASPHVTISLPAGMELDAEARDAVARVTARPPVVRENELRLVLRPSRPGGVVRIPLRLRPAVAGTLHGLGVAAWASDRPRQTGILAPRVLDISRGAP